MEQAVRLGLSPVMKLSARRVRPLGTFMTQDPWNSNLATQFTIEEYELPRRLQAIALRSPQAEHFLPESLVELWRGQKVPATHLPRLVRALEPKLMKEDCTLLLRNKSRHNLPLLVALILFVTGFVVLRLVDLPDGAARPGMFGSLALPAVLALMGAAFGAMPLRMHRARCRNQMRWALKEEAAIAGAEKVALLYQPQAAAVTSQLGSWARMYFTTLAIFIAALAAFGLVAYLIWA